ncbi:MAG: hypothetical protein R3362_03125 [Rhodothermales bacterium]|nr:hypothetical protein [Rhodothermales bacterium]
MRYLLLLVVALVAFPVRAQEPGRFALHVEGGLAKPLVNDLRWNGEVLVPHLGAGVRYGLRPEVAFSAALRLARPPAVGPQGTVACITDDLGCYRSREEAASYVLGATGGVVFLPHSHRRAHPYVRLGLGAFYAAIAPVRYEYAAGEFEEVAQSAQAGVLLDLGIGYEVGLREGLAWTAGVAVQSALGWDLDGERGRFGQGVRQDVLLNTGLTVGL